MAANCSTGQHRGRCPFGMAGKASALSFMRLIVVVSTPLGPLPLITHATRLPRVVYIVNPDGSAWLGVLAVP